jgi:hypothetical protein
MFLIPPVWHGKKAVLALPFAEEPSLAPWQYLRMVRWIIMLLIAPLLAALVIRLIDKPPSVALVILFLALIVAFSLAAWFGLGALINAREIVRLLTYNRQDNTVTLRFNDPAVAQRAREVLIEKGVRK